MKTSKFTDKKGRIITYGTGTPEEVDSLNREKDFNTALKIMAYLRERKQGLFGMTFSSIVDRTVYGKRKNA